MGVSRKLAPLSRGENSISDVGFQWSSQRYSLEELSARFRLPVVVQCVVESCQVLTSTFTFDLSQPLVLHSSRCRRKIKARSLAPSRNFDPPSEVGPPLVIPEDYDGWFVAGENGAKPPCYTKVAEVAEVAASRVLVAKRHLALVQIGSAAGVTYTERHLEPGEVLAVMGQCKGELTLPANSPFRRSRRFLRCVDERGDSLLLCLQQRGAFYQVAPRVARDDATAVVSPKQLITSRDLFPLQVRHVMGEPPVVLRQSFPRLLRLDSVFSERSMLAAPLVASRSRPRPLEVAVRSRLLFRMALNHGQLLRTREGVRALEACESGGGAYFSAIKVAFTLRPEVSPLDDLDLSLYETGPRKRRAAASSEPHVSRELPLERLSNGPPASPLGERRNEDRQEEQRQVLEEAGGPATRRAREYHGEPLTDSESDSDEGQVINGDDEDDDLDDDQASAACEVDAQSEFEIDWEPERLEGRNSSSPIDGSLARDSVQRAGEQRLAADAVNTVQQTSIGTLDRSTARLSNTEPHIRRDSANHSMTNCTKDHPQFHICFDNDETETDEDARDEMQEEREALNELEDEAQMEEQEEEQEKEEEKGEQEEEQEEEKEEEQKEEQEEEEQEEDILEEEDNDEVVVDEALATLETLDLDEDDDFFQGEAQQEDEQEKQRKEEEEEEEEEEAMKGRGEAKEEEEIAATFEEMVVMAVNEKEVPVVQEDEEEDVGRRQGHDDDDEDYNDDDDDRAQGHIQGQETSQPKEKGIEAQWKTLWIQSSGIPPLPKPRPSRRPPIPPRRPSPSPNPDIPAGPPPLPPRAPISPTASPKPSRILDILVLDEDFTTPVEV